MRTVHFYGELSDKYGDELYFEVDTVQELVRAMQANFGDFYQTIKDGSYHIVRGDTSDSGDYVLENRFEFNLGGADLHVVPLVGGAGKKGILMAVVGVALIATGVGAAPALTLTTAGPGAIVEGVAGGLGSTAFNALGFDISFGRIASFGASLLLQGLSSALAPKIKSPSGKVSVDKADSFHFSGPVNNVAQGGPVPLVYGRMLVGSVVISGGLTTEQLSAGDVPVTIVNNPTPNTASNAAILLNRDGDPIAVSSDQFFGVGDFYDNTP